MSTAVTPPLLITEVGREFPAQASLGEFVEFLATRVLVRTGNIESSLHVGTAAEIRHQSEQVTDQLNQEILKLVSQAFPVAHKLSLGEGDTLWNLACRTLEVVFESDLSLDHQSSVFDLIARTLVRCGRCPQKIELREEQLLSTSELLDLWVAYRMDIQPVHIDELVARSEATRNGVADVLFRRWKVIQDPCLATPATPKEQQLLVAPKTEKPRIGIYYSSDDLVDKTAVETLMFVDAQNTKQCNGGPRLLLVPPIIGFSAQNGMRKSSFIKDAVSRSSTMGDTSAKKFAPGRKAFAFSAEPLKTTSETSDYLFEVSLPQHNFGGRRAMPIAVRDHKGEEFSPKNFSVAQANQIHGCDALIIPIDTESLVDDDHASQARQNALYQARLLSRYRLPGVPIAINIPAADKLISEDELKRIPGCKVFPGHVDRSLITTAQRVEGFRLAGKPVDRMRQAILQNKGIASSLNTMRVLMRFFKAYEPLLEEVLAVTSKLEIFFTVTSREESGWSQTYGSTETLEWIAGQLSLDYQPYLREAVSKEFCRVSLIQDRLHSLMRRCAQLAKRQDSLKFRRDATTMARIFPWNKPGKLKAKLQEADNSKLAIMVEAESLLGLSADKDASVENRYQAIEWSRDEIRLRLHALAVALD